MVSQKKRNKAVASARAVLGSQFENIVNMCSLQPGNHWKDWTDPYGNKLRVLKNTCKITPGNNKGKINDIYYKSSFENISKHSYWSCFIIRNSEEHFWFIGTDGILRYLIRSKGTWRTSPPTLSGYKVLSYISSWYLIDQPEVLSIEGLGGQFSDTETVYLTPWPPEEEIQELLEEENIA